METEKNIQNIQDSKYIEYINRVKYINETIYSDGLLKDIFTYSIKELKEYGINCEKLSMVACISDVKLNSNLLSDINDRLVIDASYSEIEYSIDVKYMDFKSSYEENINIQKESAFNFDVKVLDIKSKNLWYMFEYSDAIDYIFDAKYKALSQIHEFNELLAAILSNAEIKYTNKTSLVEVNSTKYRGAINNLKQKIKGKAWAEELTQDEETIMKFIEPISLDLNISSKYNLTNQEINELKEECNKALWGYMKIGDTSFLDKSPILRTMKLHNELLNVTDIKLKKDKRKI